MNPAELRSMEEDLQKDLEALARVRRILESKNGSLRLNAEAKPPPGQVIFVGNAIRVADVDDPDETPVTSLRGKIEQIINSDPAVKWTTQKVLAHLQRIGFPLKAKKPIYSVGQSLNVLTDQGRIRLVRKGVGSTPNLYRGKSSGQLDDAHHSSQEDANQVKLSQE
jgi:hypothetical protein